MEETFVGRQPILTRDQKIYGYELLFRSSSSLHANVTNDDHATATVMVNALNNFGLYSLIGSKKGFMNFSAEILDSGFIDLLPKDAVVLEILESVEINSKLIETCQALKKKGYAFALDDFTYSEEATPLLAIADYVKFDILLTDRDTLAKSVELVKKYPCKLLAEKVETRDDFTYCKEIGFNYFQGYFFEKPTVIKGKTLSPAQSVLFELFNSLSREAEIETVEAFFRRNPQLDLKLLKFMNSAQFYLSQAIRSIRQAIMLLGYRNLRKWVALMLFAQDGQDLKSNPLLERASIRGLIMEKLADKITRNKELSDSAFIVGILSLSDTLLGIPMDEILQGLNLSPEIIEALKNRDGALGKPLAIVENLEQESLDMIEDSLKQHSLELEDLLLIETDAILEYEHGDRPDTV